MIVELKKNGTTIFLTTHYIEEAERICDRIAFICEGQIVATGSVPQLMDRVTMAMQSNLSPIRPVHHIPVTADTF